MEIFCRVPTLNLTPAASSPRSTGTICHGIHGLNRSKKTSNSITLKKFHDGIKSLYANKFPHDPRIRKLVYFKIFSDLYIYLYRKPVLQFFRSKVLDTLK